MRELPPKRGSIDIHSEFFLQPTSANRIAISLNGVPQKECQEYNQIEGWIDRFKRNGKKLVIENGNLVIERVKGVVSVDWID